MEVLKGDPQEGNLEVLKGDLTDQGAEAHLEGLKGDP